MIPSLQLRGRTARRRAGFLALGTGVALLRPRPTAVDKWVPLVFALAGALAALIIVGGLRILAIGACGALLGAVVAMVGITTLRSHGWLR